MSQVALSAGYYLLAKLEMHSFAEFSPRELFEVEHVEVKAGILRLGGLPIGLANRVPLLRDVAEGQPVTWDDVRIDTADEAYQYRRAMEAAFPA